MVYHAHWSSWRVAKPVSWGKEHLKWILLSPPEFESHRYLQFHVSCQQFSARCDIIYARLIQTLPDFLGCWNLKSICTFLFYYQPGQGRYESFLNSTIAKLQTWAGLVNPHFAANLSGRGTLLYRETLRFTWAPDLDKIKACTLAAMVDCGSRHLSHFTGSSWWEACSDKCNQIDLSRLRQSGTRIPELVRAGLYIPYPKVQFEMSLGRLRHVRNTHLWFLSRRARPLSREEPPHSCYTERNTKSNRKQVSVPKHGQSSVLVDSRATVDRWEEISGSRGYVWTNMVHQRAKLVIDGWLSRRNRQTLYSRE